jgi:hypothetical protein
MLSSAGATAIRRSPDVAFGDLRISRRSRVLRLSRMELVARHDDPAPPTSHRVVVETSRQPFGVPATCTLEAALGRMAPCPGPACPLWEEREGRCVIAGVERELLELPVVSAYLLELRHALEEGSITSADDERVRFFRRLNLEDVDHGGAS